MADLRKRFAIGDVHGHLDRLVWLLTSAGLVGDGLHWTGEDATVWFIGDFVDRGPDGIGVVDLVMRLQHEAADAGGRVHAILGNHEVMLLSAHRIGSVKVGGMGTFLECWRRNGGRRPDLEGLRPEHAAWFEELPAMARDGDVLLVHADSPFYGHYGRTIEDVNAAVRAVMAGGDPDEWATLLDNFADRLAFLEDPELADRFLDAFGGRMLVHGHTPIWLATGLPPRRVDRPLVYANGRCVNIDGGLYSGGNGFVYELAEGSQGDV